MPTAPDTQGVVMDASGRLAAWSIPDAEQRVEIKDCMLYALSVGFGARPDCPGHLRFVYEEGLEMVPSMVMTIATPGFWFKDPALGLNWKRLVNVGQSIEILRLPKPPFAAISKSSVIEVVDKGPQKGVLCTWERRLFCAESFGLLARLTSTVLLRGDGRARRSVRQDNVGHVYCPARRPLDGNRITIQTAASSGLLYRLNGTLNPLHADPAVARDAGFDRAIMPGTATLGIACAALLEHCCDFRPERLKAVGARLTAPVYPGELLECHFGRQHEEDTGIDFRVVAPERGVIVLEDGHAVLVRGGCS